MAFADDWARTCRGVQVPATVQGWAAAEPALAHLTLDGIMRRAQGSSPDPGSIEGDRGDAAMGALLRLAAHDRLARRAALEAVFPRLVHLARTLSRRPSASPLDEVTADLAGLAWEDLGRSGDRWATHVAARLVTHVERRYSRAVAHRLHEDPVADVLLSLELAPAAGRADVGDLDRVDIADLLRDAVHRGLLRPQAARILHDVAFGGLTDTQIAAGRGSTPAAVKKARQRALLALRAHGPLLGLRAG